EREAAEGAAADGSAQPEGPQAEDTARHSRPSATPSDTGIGATARLEFRTLGEIRIRIDGDDIAPWLLHRAAQACPVLYLLAREVRKPGDRVTRAAFADMLFPGVVRDQRRKLSRRLSELKNHDLPKPLAQRIRVDGEFVSLDLAGCDSDVGWLLSV